MIKAIAEGLIEDFILALLIILVIYFVWTKFLAGFFSAAYDKAADIAELEIESARTIGAAATSPLDTLSDFWGWATAPNPISQAQFRENISAIDLQRNIKGRQ